MRTTCLSVPSFLSVLALGGLASAQIDDGTADIFHSGRAAFTAVGDHLEIGKALPAETCGELVANFAEQFDAASKLLGTTGTQLAAGIQLDPGHAAQLQFSAAVLSDLSVSFAGIADDFADGMPSDAGPFHHAAAAFADLAGGMAIFLKGHDPAPALVLADTLAGMAEVLDAPKATVDQAVDFYNQLETLSGKHRALAGRVVEVDGDYSDTIECPEGYAYLACDEWTTTSYHLHSVTGWTTSITGAAVGGTTFTSSGFYVRTITWKVVEEVECCCFCFEGFWDWFWADNGRSLGCVTTSLETWQEDDSDVEWFSSGNAVSNDVDVPQPKVVFTGSC